MVIGSSESEKHQSIFNDLALDLSIFMLNKRINIVIKKVAYKKSECERSTFIYT